MNQSGDETFSDAEIPAFAREGRERSPDWRCANHDGTVNGKRGSSTVMTGVIAVLATKIEVKERDLSCRVKRMRLAPSAQGPC